MIISSQRVGEALGHRGILALLPERDHHELIAVWAADVDQVAALQVTDQHRATRSRPDATGSVGPGDTRSNLDPPIQRPSHPLAEPRHRVICHRDEHWSTVQAAAYRGRSARFSAALATQARRIALLRGLCRGPVPSLSKSKASATPCAATGPGLASSSARRLSSSLAAPTWLRGGIIRPGVFGPASRASLTRRR